jgi:SagB-type dehydrogenase family enzyme
MPRTPSLAEIFHEGTKYREETIRSLPPPDLSAQAPSYKDYHCEEPIDLIPYLPFPEFPLGPGTDQRPRDAALLPPLVERLSRLLYFTGGATGVSRDGDTVHLFRAAPSAGALYPTEIYLVPGPGSGLADGLYDYAVHRHQLVPVFEGEIFDELGAAAWDAPGFSVADAVIVLTGVYARSSWRYHDRAYRRILLDTGHVLGNLTLAAESEGWRAAPLAGFEDERISRLLFLDPAEEGALVVVPLVPESAVEAVGSLLSPVRRSPISHGPVGRGESLLHACHRGASIDRDDPVHATGTAPWPPLEEEERRAPIALGRTFPGLGESFRDTVLHRRSTRAFTGGTISRDALSAILDHGHRAASPGPVRILQAPERIASHLIISRVSGLEPGVYRYLPDDHEILLVRPGDFHREVGHCALGQSLAADAAAVLVHTADLAAAIETYGDRAYRYLHLDAGVIGQYANLAAVQLGIGVSGIGGFFDDAVNRLLLLPSSHAVLYLTVLGEPAPGA